MSSMSYHVDVTCMLAFFVFFFNDPAPTEIYTLSLHDALPIYDSPAHRRHCRGGARLHAARRPGSSSRHPACRARADRSEEHTSELQSRRDLVCRLLLEKKKKNDTTPNVNHTTSNLPLTIMRIN